MTRGGSPVEVLTRLFWLQVPVEAGAVADGLVAAGLAERSGGEVRALLRVEPLEAVGGDGHAGYAVSDLTVRPGSGGVPADDHVVGAGGASGNLARLVVHRPVDNVLDVGTGCGVQAVHLAGRSPGARITATDVNPRALELAAMSFALSGVEGAELVRGSLLEPVRGRRFDLIVSNPPFVVAPSGGRRFTYRESGMPGDDFCRRLVEDAARYLNDGGYCQLLANWLHVDGVPWEERVGAWVDGCDAWIVQRDVQDPAEYAELWLRDSCEAGTPEYRARYEAWLDHFDRQGVTGIGFGWITLRRSDRPAVRIEELRHAVEEPVGAYVPEVLDGLAAGAKFPQAVDGRWRRRPVSSRNRSDRPARRIRSGSSSGRPAAPPRRPASARSRRASPGSATATCPSPRSSTPSPSSPGGNRTRSARTPTPSCRNSSPTASSSSGGPR